MFLRNDYNVVYVYITQRTEGNSVTPYEGEYFLDNLSSKLPEFYCKVIILYDNYLLPLHVTAFKY
jgi:hypothetical protein